MRMNVFAAYYKAKTDMENKRLQLGGGQAYNCSSD
jgi:hypothetical protein